ncbi:MAG: EAL domain-containing protein [Campylobacterales bacterium]|nr:EAL domain-containing protein [Campylobacterales bacterium]
MRLLFWLLTAVLVGNALEIKVGVYENRPKMFTDPSGVPSGFFPDLLQAIAGQEGWTLTYVPCAWEECLDFLERGKLDMMPDVAHTPQRQKLFLFGEEAVFSSWSVLYHREGAVIESLLELQNKRVAVLRRSTQADAIRRELEAFGIEAEYTQVNHFDEAFAQLARGTVDGVLANRFYKVPKAYASIVVKTNIMLQPSTIRLAFASGRSALLERCDYWLNRFKADTESPFHTAYRRWLEPEPPSTLPLWMFGALGVLSLLLAIAALLFRREAVKRRTALHGALIEVERLSQYDDLTGLPNRVILMERIVQAITGYERSGRAFALVVFNLDNFREINEAMSHAAGDATLRHVASTLRAIVREEDMVARIGGDEFAIVLSGTTNEMGLLRIMTQTEMMFQAPFSIDAQPIYLTFSAGIALFPIHGAESSALLNNAITAMKKAKSEGKNSFVFFSPQMQEQIAEKLPVATRLREAITQGALTLYYQPKYDAPTGQMYGFEVLLRWFDTRFRTISPQETVLLAEEHGLIIALGDFVLEAALRQWALWDQKGLRPGLMSVNISALQLKDVAFVDRLEELLKTFDVEPSRIELELTESQLMTNPASAIEMLRWIHTLGIGIAIDDFGTGYSSLSYLRALPITTLKIDRSFVHSLPHDPQDVGIANAVIALAQSLGLKTVAEGVEREEQAEFLRRQGCDLLQGYLYAKPMSAEDMTRLLEGNYAGV